MPHDVRRAVIAKRIVKLRMIVKLVDSLHDVEQQRSRLGRCGSRPVKQHIDMPIFFPKLRQGAGLHPLDELVGELLAGDVTNLAGLVRLGDAMTDGLHQVRLAEADAAIDE